MKSNESTDETALSEQTCDCIPPRLIRPLHEQEERASTTAVTVMSLTARYSVTSVLCVSMDAEIRPRTLGKDT